MGILDGIKKAFEMLPDIGSSIGQLAMVLIIVAAILGVFVFQTDEGNIPVDNDSKDYIKAQSSNFSALTGSLWDAGTAVAGFIVIGVIILIGGYFLYKGKKGNMV